MKGALVENSRFLIAPSIQRYESLRGYLERITELNHAMALTRSMLSSLLDLSCRLEEVSSLTGMKVKVLARHGCLNLDFENEKPRLMIGNESIPEGKFWTSHRQFCPHCLNETDLIPAYWDLKQYSVCHRHKVPLIRHCSDCGAEYKWGHGALGVCVCGQKMRMEPTHANSCKGDLIISKMLAAATEKNLDEFNKCTPMREASGDSYSLCWVYVLIEFIQHVLIRGKWESLHPYGVFFYDDKYQDLTAALLNDVGYCRKIYDTLSAHTKANSEFLKRERSPRYGTKAIRSNFMTCAEVIGDHKRLNRLPGANDPFRERKAPVYVQRDRQRATDPGGITWRPRFARTRSETQDANSKLHKELPYPEFFYSEPEVTLPDMDAT